MNEPEHQSARMQGLDAAAHEAFVLFGESRKPMSRAVLDERITVCAADPAWPSWFQQEAARLRSALPGDLVPDIQHIGSTAVPGLDAKPIVDLMVGNFRAWTDRRGGRTAGEARLRKPRRSRRARPMGPAQARCRAAQQYCDRRLRRRMVEAQPCRPGFSACECRGARNYALAKWHAVSGGADMLLAYSDAKRVMIEMIVAEARGLLALIAAPSQVAEAPVPAPLSGRAPSRSGMHW